MKILFKPGDFFAEHLEPIWKGRSNFIISCLLSTDEGGGSWEQIWAQKISNNRFVVCCIPFFAYNLNLGDEVLVSDENTIVEVVKKSDMSTFRVWLERTPSRSVEALVNFLDSYNVLYERFSENLMAVSCSESSEKAIADYLQGEEDKKILSYETGAIDDFSTKLV